MNPDANLDAILMQVPPIISHFSFFLLLIHSSFVFLYLSLSYILSPFLPRFSLLLPSSPISDFSLPLLLASFRSKN